MIERFVERAKTRDPAIEQDLAQLYFNDSRDNSIAALMVDRANYAETAKAGTQSYREYMAREGV